MTRQEEVSVFTKTVCFPDDFVLFLCSCQSVVRLTSPLMIECHDHRQDKCLMVWLIVIYVTQTLFAFPETDFYNPCKSR